MDTQQQQQYRREGEIPSFSSTLLDAIYRSIDEGHGGGVEDELQVVYRETMKTEKHSNFGHVGVGNDVDMASLQRACLIDKWMEKKVSEKVIVRSRNQRDSSRLLFNSSSSSSDSSCGGGFSSSEAESVPKPKPKPKPIRTSVNSGTNSEKNCQQQSDQKKQQKPKSEGGFMKTKSRALKIYSDLKKVKQPISPGGRLASFLNSLFTTGNTKKPNISSSNGGRVVSYEDASNMERKSKSTHASTCSSASSFSRSCLSKTPSSRGNLNSSSINNNGDTKRSVRFYPVSVIVDEDCQPIGQKSVYGERFDFNAVKYGRNSVNGNDELQARSNEKNRRVEEAARNLLKNYQKKVECEMDMRNAYEIDEDDEEDDDAASYASSDLFELDHLSERYREELPVYETTCLDTNRAIANSLFV